jgi:hypothetical protein
LYNSLYEFSPWSYPSASLHLESGFLRVIKFQSRSSRGCEEKNSVPGDNENPTNQTVIHFVVTHFNSERKDVDRIWQWKFEEKFV